MAIDPPRYTVCDEHRRAPHNADVPIAGGLGAVVQFGPEGECGRFDKLDDAIEFGKSIWDAAKGAHLVVVRDGAQGGEVVWSDQPKGN
jgi:hypothetical protein